MLALLIGFGIDSAIHDFSRTREARTDTQVIRTWTSKAERISGVTARGSFRTLWLSPNRGMASIGELLAVGNYPYIVVHIGSAAAIAILVNEARQMMTSQAH